MKLAHVVAHVNAAALCLLIALGWTPGPAWAWALCAAVEALTAWRVTRR